MAEEETTTREDPAISSGITFTEDDLNALEADFQAPDAEEETDEPAEDEDEDADEEEGGEVEEEGEEAAGEEDADADAGDDDGGDKQAADEETDAEAAAKVKEEKEEETKGYELIVDGQPVNVDTEEDLAAWAQKGIHYEKKRVEMERSVENATFTMNAMVNDPMGSLEEIWTSKFNGNHEQARQHLRKVCEDYIMPIWQEEAAQPADRMKLQQKRFSTQLEKQQTQHQQTQAGQFTQEDIDFIQNLDTQIETALTGVDLPAEDVTLRKWMADIMRDGLGRGIQPDPVGAAQFIKSQQKERNEALGNSAPAKDRKKKKASAKTAKIAKAKARRSKRQGGPTAPAGTRRQEPQYISSREWIDDLNHDLHLEP